MEPCKQEPDQKSFLKKWTPVVVLALALAIIIIDTTLLNVSLGYVIRDLKTDIQSIQWVITAYALTIAAFTITGGRLGDLFGRKKMFVFGAIIFAAGSFIASISQNVSTMIIGESIIEGVGAALMMPATLSLLVSTYKGRDRALAMGIWGGVAAASSAIGPILGGFLTTHYSWRWGFRINIFVALAVVLGSIIIKECRDTAKKTGLDLWGVVLSSLGMLSLVFGIIESSTYGWWKAKEVFMAWGHAFDLHGLSIVPVAIAAGILILVSFVLWELALTQKGKTPLVSMKLFTNKQFISGVVNTTLIAIGQAGIIFSLPVFFQSVLGLDAFHTGLNFLPMSLAALIIAPTSAVLSRKVSPKILIQLGLLISAVAMFVLRSELSATATASDFIPGLVLYGIAVGLTMAQLSNLTISAVSVRESGEASGVNNTLRQVGSSFGSAIIGAALLTALSTNLVSGINSSDKIPLLAKPFIATAISEQTSNVEFGGGAKFANLDSPVISGEIVKISHQATTDANKVAVLYAAVVSIIGFLVSFWLPKKKDIETEESTTEE